MSFFLFFLVLNWDLRLAGCRFVFVVLVLQFVAFVLTVNFLFGIEVLRNLVGFAKNLTYLKLGSQTELLCPYLASGKREKIHPENFEDFTSFHVLDGGIRCYH